MHIQTEGNTIFHYTESFYTQQNNPSNGKYYINNNNDNSEEHQYSTFGGKKQIDNKWSLTPLWMTFFSLLFTGDNYNPMTRIQL